MLGKVSRQFYFIQCFFTIGNLSCILFQSYIIIPSTLWHLIETTNGLTEGEDEISSLNTFSTSLCRVTESKAHPLWALVTSWRIAVKKPKNTKQSKHALFNYTLLSQLQQRSLSVIDFDVIPGAHPGQSQCPACGTGYLGLAQGAWHHNERVSNRLISPSQELTQMNTAGSTQGS